MNGPTFLNFMVKNAVFIQVLIIDIGCRFGLQMLKHWLGFIGLRMPDALSYCLLIVSVNFDALLRSIELL